MDAPLALPRELFWDVAYPSSAEEWDRFYFFVVERVLQRGSIADWQRVRSYYGIQKVKEVFQKSRNLHPRARAFGVALYGDEAESKACSETALHQPLWPY
jgi:hypothetical protein